ncbi:MAG: metal ABC transporter ATP-binding protein [Dehalococcoidales bacterium]|nr:metal ABC transporter ATP-binding protein [Dehalococcoidales bacterium]
MQAETTTLEVRGFTVGYDDRLAVDGVTMAVPAGKRVAVVGPNGAGKSTLFKGMLGLIPVRGGQALFGGQAMARRLRQVAYIPQHEDIDWRFPVTVMDVVLMGRYGHLGWFRRPGPKDRQIAKGLLAEMGIAHLADRPIADLSGGQQQRVFLARALAQEPRLLLLDEPFAGIDAPTQEATLQLIDRLAVQGVTALVSTHDLELAAARFDLLLLLNRQLVAYGPPAAVLNRASLAKVFGAPSFFFDEGQRYFAITNRCCPAEGSSDVPGNGPNGQLGNEA